MSRIVVTCRCGSRFAAHPRRAGQAMPCPSCGEEIAIPGPPLGDDSRLGESLSDFDPPVENDWVARLPDGRMFGPGTLEQLRALVSAGRLPRGVEVKRRHESHWRPLDGASPSPPAISPYSVPTPAAAPAAPPPAPIRKPPRTPLRPGELTLFWKIWYGFWMTLFGLGGVVSLIATLIAAVAHPLGAIFSGMGTLFSFLGIWLLYSTFYSSGPFARDPHESPRQNMSGYHLVRYGCMLLGVVSGSAGLGQLLTIIWVSLALFLVSRNVARERQAELERARAAAVQGADQSVDEGASRAENGARNNVPAGEPGANDPAPIDPSPYLNTQLTSAPILLGRPDWLITNPHGHFIAVQQPGNHETQIIDLRDGKVVRKFATGLNDRPVAVSREGDRLFTGIGEYHIWDGPTSKHAVACDRNINQSLLRFDATGFGYSNRKATVFADLAAGNRLAEFSEISDLMTPGGKYVVRPSVGRLSFYELATGKRTADVSVPRLKDPLPLISFSRDGRFAAISQPSLESYLIDPRQRSVVSQSHLCIWDLAAGRERASLIVPTNRNKARWLGNRYLLCDSFLIDIDARRALGKYNFTQITHGFDDRLWFDAREDLRWLKPVNPIDPQQLARVQSDPNSGGRRLAGPGDGITLEFEWKTSPPAKERDEIFANCTQAVSRAGYQVRPGQTRTLHIIVDDVPTGGPDVQYGKVSEIRSRFGGFKDTVGKPEFSVPDRAIEIQAVFRVEGKIWFQTAFYSKTSEVSVIQPDMFGQLSQQSVLNQRWPGAAVRTKNLKLPEEIWNFDAIGPLTLTLPPTPAATQVAATPEVRIRQEELGLREKPIELPLAPPERPWNVEPDPIPEFTGTLVPQPMQLGAERPRDARFTSAVVAKMATLDVDEDDNFAVQRWDLKKKRKLSTNLVATDSELLDYRPDGAVYATVEERGDGDVVVWSCGENDDKEVARLQRGRAKDGGAFVGKNLLLLCSNDKLTAYQLPKGDVAYELPGYDDPPAISWGRRYFLGWVQEGGERIPAICSAADGKPVGRLELPAEDQPNSYRIPRTAGFKFAAFHPDGKHLAAATDQGKLTLWNLESGKVIKTASIGLGQKLRWCSPKHLFLQHGDLYDVEQGRKVWHYSISSDIKDSPDGKAWFFADRRVGSGRSYFVASLFMPTANVKTALEQVGKSDEPILPTGGSVKLEFTFAENDVESAGLRDRLLEAIASALQKRSVIPTDDAEPTLKVQVRAPRESRDFVVRDGGKEWRLPQRNVRLGVNFSSQRGHFGQNAYFELPKIDYRVDVSAADPGADLQRQYEDCIAKRLAAILEEQLFQERRWGRTGQSSVSLEGEKIY